jgi:hypothetical protein
VFPPGEATCKTTTVGPENGAGYMLEICAAEKELQNHPRKFGGTMGDEKAMVISGFPSRPFGQLRDQVVKWQEEHVEKKV